MSKSQPSAVLAAAPLPTVPEPAASPAAASIEVVSPDPNQIELQERQVATTPTAEAAAEEQQIEEVLQKKPDALIVAALMGNSIAKFNRNAKRTRQQTAPIKFNHSPVSETGTTAVTTTTTATGAPAATPTTPQAKVAAVLDRFKSLQLSHHHNEATGLGAVNQTYSDTKSSNVNDNRQTNSAEITTTTTTTTNTAAQNSSTTKKNTTLNTSKLAANANSRVLGSKASKCIRFFIFLSNLSLLLLFFFLVFFIFCIHITNRFYIFIFYQYHIVIIIFCTFIRFILSEFRR